jgi:hypothetical protein
MTYVYCVISKRLGHVYEQQLRFEKY